MITRKVLQAGALLAGLLPWFAPVVAAQTLDIELNKLEDIEGKCAASLVLTNRMSETLEQVRFDLYVFGQDGVIARRLLLDTGPMRVDKTTVATFALLDHPCSSVGRLLISDVPLCKTANGTPLDCIAVLNLTSLAPIPLAK
jgi:hypothetical protein